MCIAAGEMLFESLGVPPVPRPILDRGIVIEASSSHGLSDRP